MTDTAPASSPATDAAARLNCFREQEWDAAQKPLLAARPPTLVQRKLRGL